MFSRASPNSTGNSGPVTATGPLTYLPPSSQLPRKPQGDSAHASDITASVVGRHHFFTLPSLLVTQGSPGYRYAPVCTIGRTFGQWGLTKRVSNQRIVVGKSIFSCSQALYSLRLGLGRPPCSTDICHPYIQHKLPSYMTTMGWLGTRLHQRPLSPCPAFPGPICRTHPSTS